MSSHILVATDFSKASEASYPFAKQYCDLLRRAGEDFRVTVLSVIDDIAPATVSFEFGLATLDIAAMMNELEQRTQKSMLKTCEQHFSFCDAEGVVLRPVKAVYVEVTDYARAQSVTQIFLGSHGRTGAAHLFLGSVAERIVRYSPCPVTVCPFLEGE
jgi:nucleotide-binding universal stress UspA family protein